MPHRAALFDLDGTLLDTIEDLTDSLNVMLTELGAPTHDVAACKRFVGAGIEVLVRRALPEALRTDDQIERGVARMRAVYATRWDARTRPYPGIPGLLDQLVTRGRSLAILSNKPHAATVQLTERMLAAWPFDPVYGARPDAPKKPEPTVALQIAGELGLRAEQVVFVGDSGLDMQTARRAGMTAVGVAWGFRDRQELWDNGAQHLIERPAQLLALL